MHLFCTFACFLRDKKLNIHEKRENLFSLPKLNTESASQMNSRKSSFIFQLSCRSNQRWRCVLETYFVVYLPFETSKVTLKVFKYRETIFNKWENWIRILVNCVLTHPILAFRQSWTSSPTRTNTKWQEKMNGKM